MYEERERGRERERERDYFFGGRWEEQETTSTVSRVRGQFSLVLLVDVMHMAGIIFIRV
jgi:hypothetical protein